jgi:hypothetical protein
MAWPVRDPKILDNRHFTDARMNGAGITRFNNKSGRPIGMEVFGLQAPIFDERGPIDDE